MVQWPPLAVWEMGPKLPCMPTTLPWDMDRMEAAYITLSILDAHVCRPEWAHLKFAGSAVQQQVLQTAVGRRPIIQVLAQQILRIALVHSVLCAGGA